MKAPVKSVLDLIGNTPLLEVMNIDTGLCKLYLKLESQNPGGSIKDRPAKYMIEDAEKNGKLSKGGLIIEATAGNTGIGLALIALQRGYRCMIVVPDKMAREKIIHLEALGAEVLITRSDVEKGHPEYYADLAEKISKENKGIKIEVSVVEPTGADTLLFSKSNNIELCSIFKERVKLKPGESLYLIADVENIHIFDFENKKRI